MKTKVIWNHKVNFIKDSWRNPTKGTVKYIHKVGNATQQNNNQQDSKQKQEQPKHSTTKNMTGINAKFSKLTLNIISLRYLIKTHKLVDWIKKQEPSICGIQELHPPKYRHFFNGKGFKKRYSKQVDKQDSHLSLSW